MHNSREEFPDGTVFQTYREIGGVCIYLRIKWLMIEEIPGINSICNLTPLIDAEVSVVSYCQTVSLLKDCRAVDVFWLCNLTPRVSCFTRYASFA